MVTECRIAHCLYDVLVRETPDLSFTKLVRIRSMSGARLSTATNGTWWYVLMGLVGLIVESDVWSVHDMVKYA